MCQLPIIVSAIYSPSTQHRSTAQLEYYNQMLISFGLKRYSHLFYDEYPLNSCFMKIKEFAPVANNCQRYLFTHPAATLASEHGLNVASYQYYNQMLTSFGLKYCKRYSHLVYDEYPLSSGFITLKECVTLANNCQCYLYTNVTWYQYYNQVLPASCFGLKKCKRYSQLFYDVSFLSLCLQKNFWHLPINASAIYSQAHNYSIRVLNWSPINITIRCCHSAPKIVKYILIYS